MKTKTTKKPWGKFTQFTHNEKSTVKILTINPKKRFSLQYHNHRREFWLFLDNPAKVTLGKRIIIAKKGSHFIIQPKQLHRIHALKKQVNVLEISLGNFDEKDIKRIEDDFGRVKKVKNDS